MRYKAYTEATLADAVTLVLTGTTCVAAAAKYHVPCTTLQRHVLHARNGTKKQRPGPKPMLPAEIEDDIEA